MEKIYSILLTLLIATLPLGVLFRINIAPNIFLYPYDIFSLIIFTFFLVNLVMERKLVEKKLFIMLLLFLVIGFASLLINFRFLNLTQFFASSAYLIRFASYASLIFVQQKLDQKFKDSIPVKLLAIGSVFMIIGFIQHQFYPDLQNLYYLGWDEHLGRLFSTFLDPNFAGIFLVLMLILVVDKFVKTLKDKNKNAKFIYGALSFFVLISIYLTHSRSALLALTVGFIVYLFLIKKLKLIAPLVFVLFTLLLVFSNSKLEGLNPLRIASVDARLDSARTTLEIIEKNLIVGVGFNAFRYAQIRYDVRNAKTKFYSNSDAGTDNSYLFVLATTGIIGFLIYFDFWINVLKRVYTNPQVTSSVIALMTNTLFINSIFYAPIMAWIFILIGSTLNKKQ